MDRPLFYEVGESEELFRAKLFHAGEKRAFLRERGSASATLLERATRQRQLLNPPRGFVHPANVFGYFVL